MKNALLLCAILLFASQQLYAQPTLTAATNAPKIGQKYITQFANTAGVNVGARGADIVWDFSKLVSTNDVDTTYIVSPSSTHYGVYFPQASLAFIEHDNPGLYEYYATNNVGFFNTGYYDATADDTTRFKPMFRLLKFPLTYGDAYADTSLAATTSADPNSNINILLTDSVWADAYGTLKLPTGTINNVLRVKISYRTFLGGTLLSQYLVYTFFAPGDAGGDLDIELGDNVNISSISYLKNSSLLPLQILFFTAQKSNNEVALQWQTTQEVNTEHFNVQRSADGLQFLTIAKIMAKGSSNINDYTYTDYTDKLYTPAIYYRLEEVDKDGKVFYSTVRKINLQNSNGFTITPNPVYASSVVNITAAHMQSIAVYDIKGRLISTTTLNDQANYKLNTSSLSKGIYMIKMTDMSGNIETKKIVLQ